MLPLAGYGSLLFWLSPLNEGDFFVRFFKSALLGVVGGLAVASLSYIDKGDIKHGR